MPETRATTDLKIGAGVSGHLDPAMAAEHAASRCGESLGGPADFAVVFLSLHHVEAAGAIAHIVRKRLGVKALIGCSAESVIGGELEMENAPGVSVFAARLPGVEIKTFTTDDLPLPNEDEEATAKSMALAMGISPTHRASILLADPFSVPLNTMLPIISRARSLVVGNEAELADLPSFRRAAPILGGMASAALKPGGNTMLIDDRLLKQGGVGLTLCGNVRVDTLVSQGCKPIGSSFVVTGVKGQMLMTLAGRPAMDVLEDLLGSIQPPIRDKMLKGGLYIGRAVNAYKGRFGRDDFLIRQVIGVEKTNRAIAVADHMRVGQTAQFHVRDAQTASEDLALLLDAQKLYEPPSGVLLFTCNGRGSRLFEKPHHDSGAICRAFAPTPGEIAAKHGQAMPAPSHPIPLAGFFCAGEIGPVGNEVFVHGQTACAAIFRPRV